MGTREWGFLRRWYVTYEAREIPWACWLTNVGKEDGVDRFSLSPVLYTPQFQENREFASVNLHPPRRKVRNATLTYHPTFSIRLFVRSSNDERRARSSLFPLIFLSVSIIMKKKKKEKNNRKKLIFPRIHHQISHLSLDRSP